MKKAGFIFLVVSIALCSWSKAAAQYKTALGVRLSSKDAIVNNSITFKQFLGRGTAIEALLSFGDPVALGLLLEKHRPVLLPGLSFFYGGGGYVGFSSPKNIGLLGIVGVDYALPGIPLNLSFDWKPELNLFKETTFEPAALGLSMRFIF
jgi:hypothetical protein